MSNKGGRPETYWNWEEVEKLISYQCTQEEVAAFFDSSVATLRLAVERKYGIGISEFWQQKKGLGRVKLRKIQFAIAEKGGPGAATMAIYLDKKMNPTERPDLYNPLLNPPPAASGPAEPSGIKPFADFMVAGGYPAPFPKQMEMAEFSEAATEPSLELGARGYGKTDYVTIGQTAYEVYKEGPGYSCLIITKSKTRNTAIIEEIAKLLEANGVVLEKQNSTCVRVAGQQGKDHSVEAITIKSSFRGRHPKRIRMDDPVTEEDTSEAMRLLVKKKYDEAYKLCKAITIIGQPAHAFDLYADLRPLLKKLEVPYGSIPELDADLGAMEMAGIDPVSIEMSYHLRVPEEGQSVFASIKYCDELPDGEKVAYIDPSDGGDYTAVSIFRGYLQGIGVQGYAWKRAWFHCLDDIAEVFEALGVKKVAFEINKFGQQPIDQLRTALAHLGVEVVGLNSISNKESTIAAAGSVAHLIHLSKKSPRVYINQVVRYDRSSKHDDAPDSLARGLEWLGLLKGKK